MAKKRNTSGTVKTARPKSLPASAAMPLAAAMLALDDEQWDDAREMLEELDRRYPSRVEILMLLAGVCDEQEDSIRMVKVCRQLVEVAPDEPDFWLSLAGAYGLDTRPMLMLQTFDEFLRRFPDHEEAAEVRVQREAMRPEVEAMMASAGISLSGEPEVAALHDELNVRLESGDIKGARAAAERLLALRPHFVPALNNFSQIQWVEGEAEEAITTAWRALQHAPDNIHALGNLVRYCVLSGREADARQWAERLKSSDAGGFDIWRKKAESLAFLGDDEGVLQVVEQAQKRGAVQSPGADGMLAHLAAVAALRLGREKDARRWWKQAESDPANPLREEIMENLADLKNPVGERHAPWPFPLRNWLRESEMRAFQAQAQREARHSTTTKVRRSPEQEEEALSRAFRRALEQHPHLESVLPLLLDRGDAKGREFALLVTRLARTPALLAALAEFALGQRGPDSVRHQAAQIALENGVLSTAEDGSVRLWMKGEWRELMLMGMEIHDESDPRFDRATQNKVRQALDHLRNGNAVAAELGWRAALEHYPDDPTLLNNLAMALEQQGRAAESRALTEETHAKHPDYIFGRVALARLAMRGGDLARANELLKPLSKLRRIHFSELAAWYSAQIELFLAEKNIAAAQSWLEMWREIMPDHPSLDGLKKKIQKAALA